MKSGVLWRGSIGHLAVTGPIIRREAIEEIPRTVSILHEAEQMRQSLMVEHEQARQKGYAAGIEQGRASAVVEALEVLNNAQYVREKLSEDMVQIIAGALDKLLDEQVRRGISDSATRTALRQVDPTQSAQLLVSSDGLCDALELAQSQCGSPLPSWLTVRADDTLKSGDVVLVATGKLLDCRLDARLASWQANLKDRIADQLDSVTSTPAGSSAYSDDQDHGRDEPGHV